MFSGCCRQVMTQNDELYLYKGSTNNLHNRMSVRQSRINGLIEKTSQPFRIYVKSRMDNEINKIEDQHLLFNDRQFPPNKQSIGFYQGRQYTWIRLSHLYQDVQEGFYNSSDILAMKSNDSYFLASVAALTQNQSFLKGIFDSEIHISKTGFYKLRLNVRGRPRQVVLDDFFPVFSSNHQRAVFCRVVPDLIWLPLLEKAYAKAHGSYFNIGQGYAHQVFSTFSLAPCLYQMIPTDFRQEQQDKCWNTILQAYECSFPIAFGSRKEYTCKDIVPHQTYCLKECLNFRKGGVSQRRIVLWNLPEKVGKIQTKQIREEQDGLAINLPLVQFMRNFQMIDTTHIRRSYNSYFYPFASERFQPKLFSFEVHQKTNIYLTLIRQSGERSRLRILLINYTNEATYQFIAGKKEDIYNDVTIRLDKLPIGKYILICQSYSKSQCLVRVYTQSSIPLLKFEGNLSTLLQHTFFYMSCSLYKQRQRLSQNKNDWYLSKQLFQQLGYGVFIISLDDRSNIECQLSVNKINLQRQGMRMVNKMFKQNYCNKLQKGQTDILIFQLMDDGVFQTFSFPPSSLKIKMIV